MGSKGLSPAQTLQVIHLRFTCDWTFKLLATAGNRSFNMLNDLLDVLIEHVAIYLRFLSHLLSHFSRC